MQANTLNRRAILGGAGLALAPAYALAEPPPHADVHFEVLRNGRQIGAHSVSFRGDDQELVADIAAEMLIKLGPIPLFNYRHRATEIWRAGRFISLEARSVTNGKVEHLSAERTAGGLAISTGPGRTIRAAAEACPLTHWNAVSLEAPLFSPQTGVPFHVSVARGTEAIGLPDGRTVIATRYQLHGDVDIADFYDPAGTWIALRGKATDGSSIAYRRA